MDKPAQPLYKYPRTPHLPESLGATSDDKIASKQNLAYLSSGIELVTTEKMDGGNLTMYSDYFHSRSLDSGVHAWDKPAKALWASVRHSIPLGWRVSGESMYARRSVSYDQLDGVYMVFGIWDETNTLLSWDDMVACAEMLELPVVPLLYRGSSFTEAKAAWKQQKTDADSEGFVIRDAGMINYGEFGAKVAKYVRANHVRTSASWRGRDDFELNGFRKLH
jgi:RNA ligase